MEQYMRIMCGHVVLLRLVWCVVWLVVDLRMGLLIMYTRIDLIFASSA